MTARFRIHPYKVTSKSAKNLADALGGKRLKLNNSSFIPEVGDVVINWGNSKQSPYIPRVMNIPVCHYLNPCEEVKNASNKLQFFELVKDNGHADIIPEYWTNAEDIPDEVFPVVCRTLLSSHSGNGIHIANTRSDLVDCPLYVRYIKKQEEYRVHLGITPQDEVKTILFQQKARRLDCDNPNWQIRNHQNGFIYKRENVHPPQSVLDMAKLALLATGLDFGAVDVIWNNHLNRAYVLEVNTAPGLEGSTITDYASFFLGNFNA